ncbi:hypothetical protein P0Y67_14745 [Photobacterium sp. SP02]|uniref:hypothetical protein n=1 Tax=Photobacterium sp. SP02 TaxID=3032280 RepID=UPI0031454930
MARTVRIEPGVYLMGRLHDQNGRVCKNAKLTTLRFETLALPEKEIIEITNFNGEGEVVHKIDAKYPIASTDEVGKLSFLRSEDINIDRMSLVSIPTMSNKTNNEYKVKFNFSLNNCS